MIIGIAIWVLAIIGAFYAYKKQADRYNNLSPDEKIAYELHKTRVQQQWRDFGKEK